MVRRDEDSGMAEAVIRTRARARARGTRAAGVLHRGHATAAQLQAWLLLARLSDDAAAAAAAAAATHLGYERANAIGAAAGVESVLLPRLRGIVRFFCIVCA